LYGGISRNDFFVADLIEVFIHCADCAKPSRRNTQHHKIIDLGAQPGCYIVSRHWNRDRDSRRQPLANFMDRREHGQPGSQSVVYNDGNFVLHGNRRTALKKNSSPAFGFRQGGCGRACEPTIVECCCLVRICNDIAVFGDGADCVLGLQRMSDLAHHNQIQRRFQKSGDFGAHYNSAARQRIYNNRLPFVGSKSESQLSACISAIAKHGAPPLPSSQRLYLLFYAESGFGYRRRNYGGNRVLLCKMSRREHRNFFARA